MALPDVAPAGPRRRWPASRCRGRARRGAHRRARSPRDRCDRSTIPIGTARRVSGIGSRTTLAPSIVTSSSPVRVTPTATSASLAPSVATSTVRPAGHGIVFGARSSMAARSVSAQRSPTSRSTRRGTRLIGANAPPSAAEQATLGRDHDRRRAGADREHGGRGERELGRLATDRAIEREHLAPDGGDRMRPAAHHGLALLGQPQRRPAVGREPVHDALTRRDHGAPRAPRDREPVRGRDRAGADPAALAVGLVDLTGGADRDGAPRVVGRDQRDQAVRGRT